MRKGGSSGKGGTGSGKGKGHGSGKKTKRERPPFRIPGGTSDPRLAQKLGLQETAERALNAIGITDPAKHKQIRNVFGFINQLFHDAIARQIKREFELCVRTGIDPFSEPGKKMIERNIIRTLVHDEKFGALIESGVRGALGESTNRFLDEYKRLMNE